MSQGFRDLRVWSDAVELIRDVYEATKKFPPDERYGLSAQMRRAAISVSSNIAEGNARGYRKEYAHHVGMAQGSLAELENHVEVAVALKYLDAKDRGALLFRVDPISRKLRNLRKYLSDPRVGDHPTQRAPEVANG